MPINIPKDLPAQATLSEENIFVMTEDRALSQDIRPLRIAIVNLMPTKITTETQLLRLLGNSPLQVNIVFVTTASYQPKHVPQEHLERFYVEFDKVRHEKFDGMIVTGAPVENLPFEAVDYWEELKEILDFSLHNAFSSLYICWGAQAALYRHYGVPKHPLPQKMFGVFQHTTHNKTEKLFRGFDDTFHVPHSRHTETRHEDVSKVAGLSILSESPQSGIFVVSSQNGRQIYATGHLEYDATTLQDEYLRDLSRGMPSQVPLHYYPEDDPQKAPLVKWRAHAHLFFSNWLNYYVYQETPYVLNGLG
ncbi:MAG: homoserine O-succinyltransferase [Proteobacteria bacterium]|nr:homoserine O-succinyltransferase [Cystobacterineae bacterium]MCL2259049.1 homoserine O-succinyltransferase [Cystobacterineae bacterium]MCL2314607.1 homoserine O-succinyltransferase [Pseudomonadota bacterium]